MLVALVAFGMQLGAIAAITGYTCTQEDSDGFLELDQTATSTDGEFSKSVSGRRLLGTPSASEFKARCSYYYGFEYTNAFLLLAIVVGGLRASRTERRLAANRVRIAAFSVIHICWSALILTWYASQVANLGNALRDAEVKDNNYDIVLGERKTRLWRGYQTYFAGLIIAIIALMGWLQQVLEGPEAADYGATKAEASGGGGAPHGAARV